MEIYKNLSDPNSKEFEQLLNNQLSKIKLTEGTIVEGKINKITDKFVFLFMVEAFINFQWAPRRPKFVFVFLSAESLASRSKYEIRSKGIGTQQGGRTNGQTDFP